MLLLSSRSSRSSEFSGSRMNGESLLRRKPILQKILEVGNFSREKKTTGDRGSRRFPPFSRQTRNEADRGARNSKRQRKTEYRDPTPIIPIDFLFLSLRTVCSSREGESSYGGASLISLPFISFSPYVCLSRRNTWK